MPPPLLAAALLSAAAATQAPSHHLLDCVDEKAPWPCTEDGCPEPLVGCESLARQQACGLRFDEMWETPPENTDGLAIFNVCPRACSRCGVIAPTACNMRVVAANELSEGTLAQALLEADAPIVIRSGGGVPVKAYESLLEEHTDVPVEVIVEGGTYRGEATKQVEMRTGDYFASIRNRSLPDGAYIFFELGGVDHRVGADVGLRLAGVGVSDASRALAAAVSELAGSAALMRRQSEARPDATDGRLLLSAGSWGNGRPFHAHGPALFTLVTGAKHWLVRRPNASFAWQTFEVDRQSLADNVELPDGWGDHLWRCTQREGDLLWVPNLYHHATLNYAPRTVGFAMVIDELNPITPLHAAAQDGAAEEVRRLLAGGAAPDAAAANGGTALHYASGLGHAAAVAVLLEEGGASVHHKAQQGVTPLHVAAAGGHADAVRLLVRHGAALDERTDEGHTPLDLATSLGHDVVVQLLSDAASHSAKQRGVDRGRAD